MRYILVYVQPRIVHAFWGSCREWLLEHLIRGESLVHAVDGIRTGSGCYVVEVAGQQINTVS